MSDVCKHCVQAGCLEVCPTGAIVRTEFDTVVIQADVCNGCRNCLAGLPVRRDRHEPGDAHGAEVHALLRPHAERPHPGLRQGLPHRLDPVRHASPTCAGAPTRACSSCSARACQAYIYGDEKMLGGLNAFFLLMDQPEVYGLPANPQLPSRNLWPSSGLSIVGAVGGGLLGPGRLPPAPGERRVPQTARKEDHDAAV